MLCYFIYDIFCCFHHSLERAREVNYPIVIYYNVIEHNFGGFLMYMSKLVQCQQFRVGVWEVDLLNLVPILHLV